MDPGTAAIVGGMAIQTIGGIFGGSKRAAAAQDQAIQQAKATNAKHQYDLDMWDMKRQQLQSQRSEAVDRINLQARNQGRERAYRDVQGQQQYDYNLKIRNQKNVTNEIAFKRSEDIYHDTTSLNNMSARSAMDSEIIKLQEAKAERAFDANDSYIEQIEAEGKLRARASTGRSARKGYQANMADYGRQTEMLNATSDSQDRNARAILEGIIQDKTSADLTAFASKMLKPTTLPEPLKQAALPTPEYSLPRLLEEFDFGPQPVRGFMASPGAAADMAWGSTISSVAGSIGSGLSSLGASGNFGGGSGGMNQMGGTGYYNVETGLGTAGPNYGL
tara:strand:+ start:54 stop:1052 length:999 start_codon:yes stop_codon:yes gene_type:complete